MDDIRDMLQMKKKKWVKGIGRKVVKRIWVRLLRLYSCSGIQAVQKYLLRLSGLFTMGFAA